MGIAVSLVCLACGETRSDASSAGGAAEGSPADVAARPARPGIPFDPSTLRPGHRVGDLEADSVTAQLTTVDSTWVGHARFRGQIEVTGRIVPHPDADMRDVTSCFEADSVSAARLPRWSGDERRPWFCFANYAEAERAIGKAGDASVLTVVIDQFTIYRNLSDAVNSATLVRLVRADSATR